MKIVHAVYSMEMGGAEMVVNQLCRIQRARGHEVTVSAYSMQGVLGEALEREGIAVQVLGIAPVPVTMGRYLRYFLQTRPDVVHCHNPAPTLQAAMGARLAGVRQIVSTRHSLVARPYDTAAEIKYNLMSWCVDRITGICECTCDNLRETPLARRSRILRVYNGAASLVGATPLYESEAGRFNVVYVGRLEAVKDLGTLLRAVALAALRVPLIHLSVVGAGSQQAGLQALATELGMQQHVTFHGQQQQVARYFRAAQVLAMSSTSEGLPMSLLQGMSLGLPAVVTDVGGMAEVVRLSGGGLTVPVGDAAGMADAFVTLAQQPALRAELSELAKTSYERHFTLERMADAFESVYRGERLSVEV